jgi:predicted membrane protein
MHTTFVIFIFVFIVFIFFGFLPGPFFSVGGHAVRFLAQKEKSKPQKKRKKGPKKEKKKRSKKINKILGW